MKSGINALPRVGPQSSPGLPPFRARHLIIGILVIVDREHRNEHVEVGRVFDVPASWILRGFDDRLANRRLHFIGIGIPLKSKSSFG